MRIAKQSASAPMPFRRRIPGWLVDVIVGATVLALAVAPFMAPVLRPSGPWVVVLMVLPVLFLPLRRRFPLIVLAACVVLYAVIVLSGTLALGIAVATAVAMFTVAATRPRRAVQLIVLITVVLIVALGAWGLKGTISDPRVLQFALIVALAAALGDGARNRREYISAITERAERAERTRESEALRRVSEERLRIARDLHDAVAHQIAVISLNAGVASAVIDAHPEKAKESLAGIRSAARTVLGEIGDLLGMLRSGDADTEPAAAAPQADLARIDELVAQFSESGLKVTTRTDGDLSQVAGAAGIVGYRVVQEALTNAHKHGAQRRAHVLIEVAEDAVTVTVTNPVGAADPPPDADPSAGSGLGLIGLRERVASVRGSVETGPAAAGWKVVARLPLTRKDVL